MKNRKTTNSGIGVVPLLLCLVPLLLSPAAVCAEWAIERVDTLNNVGEYSSIAVDGSNRLHISYYAVTGGDLKYAKKDVNSLWVTTAIDKAADTGLHTSIGVRGAAHISYYNAANTKLRYADNGANGAWQTQDIDVAHNVGKYTSLCVDGNEKTHISYYDSYDSSLKYATNAGGTWQISTVDDTGNVGVRSSIGLDSAGRIHISYCDVTNRSLKYAMKDGAGWHVSTLDASGDVGLFSSLVISTDNSVHISYEDVSHGYLKYAGRTENGPWQTSVIDGSGAVGGHIAITADDKHKLYISYYDRVNGDLRYATNMSGQWVTEAVDTAGDVGQFTSIAVGADRRVHISYYDIANGDLKYATRNNPVISSAPVAIVFDPIPVGSMSAPRTITMTNKGAGTLTTGGIVLAGQNPADFTLANDACSNRTLPPQGSCTVDVIFDPLTAGAKSAAAMLPSNDPETPSLQIPLTSVATANYTISASAGAGGAISPAGPVTVNQGASQTFTITPDDGFYVADLLVDGVSAGALTRYSFINVVADHAIQVVFASSTRIGGNPPVYYGSLQAAYAAAPDGTVIENQAINLLGNLLFDRNVSLYLDGGYNFDFTLQDSTTTIDGLLEVSDGTVAVENLTIQ